MSITSKRVEMKLHSDRAYLQTRFNSLDKALTRGEKDGLDIPAIKALMEKTSAAMAVIDRQLRFV